MKKLLLLLIIFSISFFSSCSSETSDIELKPQTIEASDNNQAFFPGKIQGKASQSKSVKGFSNIAGCGVSGPKCASSNQTLTYTYAGSNNVTWTVTSGNISVAGGQGTNTVSLNFGSNFTGGVITAVNSESPSCTVILEILKCGGTPTPTCGIIANGIYELNLLGDENVIFYTTTTTSSGWLITSSFFTVTYQNGDTSHHVGYTNQQGYQQIIIPVSCTNKVRKVKTTIYGGNISNTLCSDSITRDWGAIGVCGTDGFN